MRRLIIPLFACLVVSGCANELVLEKDDALAVVPRRISDSGHIIVETSLNGLGPFQFAIDTGASISVLYERTRAKVGIEPDQRTKVNVLGMTGSGVFPLGRLTEVRIGSEPWNNARVAILPDTALVSTRIDGILGVDFLSRYAVLYSHQDRVLRLYPAESVSDNAYRGWDRVALRELRVGTGNVAVFVFDMYVGAEHIPTVFDLGTTVNIMNRRAARALNILVRRPRSGPEVQGVSGSAEVLAELRVWTLRINNSLWRDTDFLVGEFPVFEALGLDRQSAAIAGVDLFGRRDFIIDFARQRLLVKSAD